MSGFIDGGITVGDGTTGYNEEDHTFVVWCLKAGGAPTASDTGGASRSGAMATNSVFKGGSNFSFTPASGAYYPTKMSFADHRGFSIVTWTGDGTNSDTTIPHGLDGAPEFVITKNTDTGTDWLCKHKDDGLSDGTNLRLNSTDTTSPAASGYLKAAGLTADTFEFDEGDSNANNFRNNNEVYMAYCFKRVSGLIGIGKYTGNGSADGPAVIVDDGASGFKPAWFMSYRVTDDGYSWQIVDSVRDPENPLGYNLSANSNGTDGDGSGTYMDFTSSGVKIRTSSPQWNSDGKVYIYLAFAESSFGSNNRAR